MPIEFRILGPVEALERGRLVVLGGPRPRAVLAILILARGQVVTSDQLIDELWGERPPATAAKTLQGYVSRLRKALGEDVLLTRGRGYVLAAEPEQVDAWEFERLAAEAHEALARGDARAARALLTSALDLWRGDALADIAYEPFAVGEVARLEEARLAALEDRIDADLAMGRHGELVGELEKLVARHPYRERARAQLMLALYRSGRHAEALDTYRQGRRALAEELGLEPGPALRTLEQRILDHDPALAQPRTAALKLRAGRRPARLAAIGALLLTGAIVAAVAELAGGSGSGAELRVAPNTVAAIDIASDRVVATVPVGIRPGPITFGSGALWIANLDDDTVSRVNPGTLSTQRTISLAQPPTAIAAADNQIWVVTSNVAATNVSVDRIDPDFDDVETAAQLGDIVLDSASAVSGGAALWVAPYAGLVSRLDPASGRVLRQVDPNANPSGIAAGAGAVWVTDSVADTVTRIDPTGALTVIPVGHGPSGIAVGDGAVWVTDTEDDTVVRIDPATEATTATIPVGEAPTAVTVGAGSVWVADSGDGSISRIDPDPREPRVEATITLGGSPQAIAIAGGRVWVTVDARVIPSSPAGGGTLRVESQNDVDFLDPALADGPLSWQLLYPTCAKLVNYPDRAGAAGSQLVPEVARSLPEITDGGRTYTFTIRRGFRFSPPLDTPVTAQAFKWTIERTLSPVMHSPVDAEFDDIIGARAYMAGKAGQISGVVARGATLTIHLTGPAPDLLSRLAQPFFCVVPPTTPVNAYGERIIPSAGPYYVSSYAPGAGIVLTRNPDYHGDRPRRFARIDVTVGVTPQRAVAQVKAGTADYAVDGEVDASDGPALAARYGPSSPAASRGHQQYFVKELPGLAMLVLNTHRAAFANPALRRAVNYAIDRTALARLGYFARGLPARPTSNYIPPGVPGFSDVQAYPLTADVTKARLLARRWRGTSVTLMTCASLPCREQARVLKSELAAIGLRLQVQAVEPDVLFTKVSSPRGWDISMYAYAADYFDPDDFLNLLLETGTYLPTFEDPPFAAQLAAAARLTGTRRYLEYSAIAADLARNGAPFVVFAILSTHELFSARIGCESSSGVYGTDLGALCVRPRVRESDRKAVSAR